MAELDDLERRLLEMKKLKIELLRERAGELPGGPPISERLIEEPPVPSSMAITPRLTAGDIPRSLAEGTRGFVSQPVAATVGGAAGALAGAGAGPAGIVGGEILGAAGGTFAFQALEDLAAEARLIARPEAPTARERVSEATTEAALSLAGPAAVQLIRPIRAGRALLAKIFQVTNEEALRATRLAELRGIPVGAVEVGGEIPKIIQQTTSVFPITGTPARRAFTEKSVQISKAVTNLLNEMAPNATLLSAGVDLKNRAVLRFGKFRNVSARLYAKFNDLAARASNTKIIPTESTKELGETLAQLVEEEKIFNAIVEEGEKEIAPDLQGRLIEWLSSFKDLPEAIDIKQYRGLVRKLKNFMDEAKVSGLDFKEAANLKQALEVDLNNLKTELLPEGEAEALRSSLDAANAFYAKTAAKFETQVAKKFGRFDRRIFGPGPFEAGSVSSDELANIVLNLKSPEALAELSDVVGRDALAEAGAAHLQNALRLAKDTESLAGKTVETLDVDDFLKNIGITGKRSTDAGVNFLMKQAGVDPNTLFDILNTARLLQPVGQPGTFVKRRVILGGASSALAGLGFGAALSASTGSTAGGTAATLVIGTFLARWLSRVSSDPKKLKLLQGAFDQTKPEKELRAIWGRIVNDARRFSEAREQAKRNSIMGTEAIGP